MAGKKKNNNKKKPKQSQKAAPAKPVESESKDSGETVLQPELEAAIPQQENRPETKEEPENSAPLAASAVPEIPSGVNILDQIDWAEIQEDDANPSSQRSYDLGESQAPEAAEKRQESPIAEDAAPEVAELPKQEAVLNRPKAATVTPIAEAKVLEDLPEKTEHAEPSSHSEPVQPVVPEPPASIKTAAPVQEDDFFDKEIEAAVPSSKPQGDFFDNMDTIEQPAEVSEPPVAKPEDVPAIETEKKEPSDFFDQLEFDNKETVDTNSHVPEQEPDFFEHIEENPEKDVTEPLAEPVPEPAKQEADDGDFFSNVGAEEPAQQTQPVEKPGVLALQFDYDDDDFLESDEDAGAPALSSAPAANTAVKSLAFLEEDDDLLSDEDDSQPAVVPVVAPVPERKVRPTQSLHFDTAKRGFDLPMELMSKTKAQTRHAPQVIHPLGQPQAAVPKSYTAPPSAPAGALKPSAPPKTPVNPYATVPKQTTTSTGATKPIVPAVPEHILSPPKPAGNPYGAPANKPSPYAPKTAVSSSISSPKPSPYAPAPPVQPPAQINSKPAPAPGAPPKGASKYQRSSNKDPYGFPELKTAQSAPRARSSLANMHNNYDNLDPATKPTVTDFNTSYGQQQQQQGQQYQGQQNHYAPNAPQQNYQPQEVPQEIPQQAYAPPKNSLDHLPPHQQQPQQHYAPPPLPVQPVAPRQNPPAPSRHVQESHGIPEEPQTMPVMPKNKAATVPNPYTPVALPAPPQLPSNSGRTTPSMAGNPRSPRKSAPAVDSPYSELHLSRPPSELGSYIPPQVPQSNIPTHASQGPTHQPLPAVSPVPSQHIAASLNTTGNATDDRLRRQIPILNWSKDSVVRVTPPEISYGQTLGVSIDIKPVTSLSLMEDFVVKYPGPLVNSKGPVKNKKKDLEKWINGMKDSSPEHSLLWALMAILVKELPEEEESKEIQALLDPTVAATVKSSQLKSAADLFDSSKKVSGHSRKTSTQIQGIFDQIQQGNRDAALQTAIDNHEWAHALILAYSEGDGAWDSVVKEFVRFELRSQNTPSSQQLAFAYRVFAGSGANAVDELRPLRSADSSKVSDDVGLDSNLASWRNYVAILLANRSKNDSDTLERLGKVLVERNMVEAGHTCAILSGKPIFGSDDMPLLGTASATGHNLSSLLLSEVYEYVLLARKKIALPLPQLVVYKASLAGIFADAGYLTEGSKLSESALGLARTLRTPEIINICETINQRCANADSGSGWISRKLSRPRLDKMFGTSFNKFVSGDDGIEEEQQPLSQEYSSRPASAGPVSGAYGYNRQQTFTPSGGVSSFNESRSSTPGVYDHYRAESPRYPTSGEVAGDFAPQGHYGNPQHTQQALGTPGTPQNIQNYPNNSYGSQTFDQPITPATQPPNQYVPGTNQFAPSNNQYAPPPLSQYAPAPNQYAPAPNQYAPAPNQYGQGAGQYAPVDQFAHSQHPPVPNQYQGTPVSAPAAPVPEPIPEPEPVVEEKPKKQEKKKEDTNKDDKGEKKGWFGGWFGKGDDKDGKTIKAKLDSGSTFYFDEKLGKWVNKNGPPPEETKPAAPPPMKKKAPVPMPAPAPASAPAPPSMPSAPTPLGVPSPVNPTPAQAEGTYSEPGGPAAGLPAPPSAPSVPSTAPPGSGSGRTRTRGSIDDLLGGPPATATRKKRNARNRYVDVTQTQS